jgi:hypothetical protein
MSETPDYRAMLNEAAAKLRNAWGHVDALGGMTLADLLAALNKAGIGPEDVEICGNGENYGIELWLVSPFDDDEGDDDDPEPEPTPQPTGSTTA